MQITGLVTIACLAIYVSGAVVFRFPDGETTTTPVYSPTTPSTTILTPLTSHDVPATAKALLPDLECVLFPPDGPTTTGSSVSSMFSSTSSPTPTRTYTSSSTKSAAVLSTPSGTLTISPSIGLMIPDATSWKPTVSPSTSSAVPASGTSANTTWENVGIAVSVVTLTDIFLRRPPRRDQGPLGDEEFLPDNNYENYDTRIRGHNGKWARETRESARLNGVRYLTDVFYGDGSTLGPGKAGIGAGGAGTRGAGVTEFGQLDRPSRPSFLQRLSMLSLRPPSPVSPRFRTKGHSPGIGNAGDGFAASTLSPAKMSAF